MARFKLQLRIALLIAGISLLLIFIFTAIQLRNDLDRLRSYDKFRARVGTIIVKTTLEMMVQTAPTEEALSGIFKAAVSSFSKEAVVEKISIISTDGKAIATNEPMVEKFGEAKTDIDIYYRLSKKQGTDTWFYSTINEKTQSIIIYIPLAAGEKAAYIAKLSFSIGNVREAMIGILVPVILTAVAVVLANIFLGVVLSYTVVHPIKVLDEATKDISAGNLDRHVEITTNDEIEELGSAFNAMAVALKKMKERAENANPLTRLPGNNVIREEIEKRIRNDEKFVAIHIDLDNFKAYNDHYGVGKGDEVIKFTGQVLKSSLEDKGTKNDFLGHEGGDDFFVITTPEKAQDVADAIIQRFDKKISEFYPEGDRRVGFIMEKSRDGNLVKFPLITISLAGITNQFRKISNYGELTNIAVGIKRKAKETKKSNFVLDRRRE